MGEVICGLDAVLRWRRSARSGSWLSPDKMEIRAHDWKPDPSIEWRTAMCEYVGLDVSSKETAVSVRKGGNRTWRGKCPSDPKLLAELIRKRAPEARSVVFETGPCRCDFTML